MDDNQKELLKKYLLLNGYEIITVSPFQMKKGDFRGSSFEDVTFGISKDTFNCSSHFNIDIKLEKLIRIGIDKVELELRKTITNFEL